MSSVPTVHGDVSTDGDGTSVILPWHVFGGYQAVNTFAFLFNCYGRLLPGISSAALYTSLVSFFVILVAVPAKAPTHQEARFVFANFVNNTGWDSNGIAFIVGLINTNWAFACLDCATHMAEEVAKPEKMVPIAIMGTVAIGFVTAWFYSIAMFFSMQSLDDLFNTKTLVPILELFYQTLGNRAGAIALESLIVATGIGCQIASHTWQSRLAWSFARDRGLPFSSFLNNIHPTLGVPLRAHAVSSIIVSALGCLYLGSSTALYRYSSSLFTGARCNPVTDQSRLKSIITACIVLLYISYAIPVICLLIRGRSNIVHGPFWMGSFGLFSNIVLLVWTVFTFVMYSFPPSMPVYANSKLSFPLLTIASLPWNLPSCCRNSRKCQQ